MLQNFSIQNIYSSDEELRITMSKQWLEKFIIKFGLMAVESNASSVELLEYEDFVGALTSGIPIGHNLMKLCLFFWGGHKLKIQLQEGPNLMTLWRIDNNHNNQNKPKNIFFFKSLKYWKLWKGILKTNCYQEPLVSFIKVGHFGCFDVSIIMWDRVGKYGMEGNIWVMAQDKESESS